jgi:hypothetical protein
MEKCYYMTKEELDSYLESIGGLMNGWKEDPVPIIDSNYFAVGEGWYLLLKELIDDLIELGWDKKITQVKEKFGGLSFYINSASDEVHKRIGVAETLSYYVCETCGEPGELRRDLGWYFTLCEDHYAKRKEERETKLKNQ